MPQHGGVLAQAADMEYELVAQPGRITLYLSDHGESLGEYGLFLHGMPYAVAPEEQKNMISVGESEKITYQDTYGNIWKRDLLRIICEYNFCRILLHGGTTYMVVVGTRENAEVVLSLYNYLRSVFRRLSVERCTEYVATRRGYYRTKKFKRNYIKSYLLGCCTGLRKQFESIRKTAEETGLMLCHNHLIDDYFQSIGTTTHKSKNRNKVNASAYCSGYDDGSKINLNKQINGK